MEIPEHRIQRETVPLAERNDDAVVCCCGLQLEIERHTETFPQSKSPGSGNPSAERRMDDQLHPAAFVEKPLGDESILRRYGSQYSFSGSHILNRLLSPALVETAFLTEPAKDGVLRTEC